MASAPHPSEKDRDPRNDALRRRLDPAPLESLAAILWRRFDVPPSVVAIALAAAESDTIVTVVVHAFRPFHALLFYGPMRITPSCTVGTVVDLAKSKAFSDWSARRVPLFVSRVMSVDPLKSGTSVWLSPSDTDYANPSTPWNRLGWVAKDAFGEALLLWDACRRPEPGFAIPPESKLMTYSGSGLASPFALSPSFE